jgi:hypothetical protein
MYQRYWWSKSRSTQRIPIVTTLIVVIITIGMIITISGPPALSVQRAQAQVDTNDISNGAVTSPKIRDGEVRNPDIADDAVTTDKIRPGAVVTESIADNSITSDKLAGGSTMLEDLGMAAGLGGGENQAVSQIIFNTCSIDFDSVAAQKAASAFCPVPGAAIGDHVLVTSQDPALDLITQSASVNGSELIKIAVWNPTFKSVDPPKATWALIVFRS